MQKLFDITATDLQPRVRNLCIDQDSVCITWDEAPLHESVYGRKWLQAHAYDKLSEMPEEQPPVELWHASRWTASPPPAYLPDSSTWHNYLNRLGFALLRDLPPESFLNFLRSIGPIQPTEFGDVAPLRASLNANDLGETGCHLDPHTDYSVYMHFPPVLSFLHCIRNDSDGGVSILVDGFAAAEHFRREDPAGFDLLACTRLPFHQLYGRWRYHHKRLRPMIELDEDGSILGVHVGHPHTRNWRFPFDTMAPLYMAYSRFIRILNDASRQFYYRLQPNECLVFLNQRVLHGRTAFSPDAGERHLQVAYVNWSYFAARRRFEDQRSSELV